MIKSYSETVQNGSTGVSAGISLSCTWFTNAWFLFYCEDLVFTELTLDMLDHGEPQGLEEAATKAQR